MTLEDISFKPRKLLTINKYKLVNVRLHNKELHVLLLLKHVKNIGMGERKTVSLIFSYILQRKPPILRSPNKPRVQYFFLWQDTENNIGMFIIKILILNTFTYNMVLLH